MRHFQGITRQKIKSWGLTASYCKSQKTSKIFFRFENSRSQRLHLHTFIHLCRVNSKKQKEKNKEKKQDEWLYVSRATGKSFFLDFYYKCYFLVFFAFLFITLRGKENSRALIGRNFKLVCESFLRETTIFKIEKRNKKKCRKHLGECDISHYPRAK